MLSALFSLIMIAAIGFVAWKFRSQIQQVLGAFGAATPGGVSSAGYADAYRGYFEKSGYRYPDIATQPVDAQVERGMALMAQMTKNPYGKTAMVRRFRDLDISWTTETKPSGTGFSMAAFWTAPLRGAARVVWHVGEKKFSGVSKLAKEMVSNTEHRWGPAYSQRIETGNAKLDERFQVWGESPQAVLSVLADPALQAALLALDEVDLVVRESEVSFADPMQTNVRNGMGGTSGMLAAAGNPAKLMEMSLPVHDRISQLMVEAARVSA